MSLRYFSFLTLSSLLLSSASVQASPDPNPVFNALQTSEFQVLSKEEFKSENPSRYTDSLEYLNFDAQENTPMSWAPNGRSEGAPSAVCASSKVEEILLRTDQIQSAKAAALQEFLSRCEPELTQFYRWWVRAVITIESSRYNLAEAENIRPVLLTLSGNVRLRGVLAVKPGEIRRPLIIIKCGLYCDSEDSPSTRVILMHLFDEGPFNVLVLSNVTGIRFSQDNGHFSLGGFDEGRHLFLTAQLIQRTPLIERTSSIHVAGLSMGGQAALFAALYNDFNPAANGNRLFKSALSLCPIVDLDATLRASLSGGIRGKIFRYFTLQQLLSVFSSVPVLGKLFDPKNPPDNSKLRDIVAKGALDYYRSLSERHVQWTLPPFQNANFEKIEDLWTYNNFLTYQSQVSTPTLVWASDDDGVVPADINAHALQKAIQEKPGAGAIQVIETLWGSHCATSVTHGWETTGAFARSYFLSNSPEFTTRRTEANAPLPERLPRGLRLQRDEEHLRQTWRIRKGESSFLLEFEIWSPGLDSRCISLEPGEQAIAEIAFAPNHDCIRRQSVRVRLADTTESGLGIPRTDAEAEALTRWANANLKVVSARKTSIDYSRENPATVIWSRYD